MSRATSTDYAGRTVDLLAFQGLPLPDQGERRLRGSVADDHTGGLVAAGLVKLMQRYARTLLLERGTMRSDPEAGCDFMTEGRLGGWRTGADVSRSFYAAQLDVRRQILAAELDADPDDERLDSATLLGVGLSGSRAELRVQLTSKAGEGATYLLPAELSALRP